MQGHEAEKKIPGSIISEAENNKTCITNCTTYIIRLAFGPSVQYSSIKERSLYIQVC
jgi:hypothetical protein